MKVTRLALLLIGAMGLPLAAQPSLDNSANNLLQGTYYFREVVYFQADVYGDLNRALSVYGNMTFHGDGTYALSATIADSSASVLQSLNSSSGTYGIAPSGFGWVSSPGSPGDVIYGLVSNNIFVGSSTESKFNDMFVAALVSSPPATKATFTGSYSVAGMDFPDGTVTNDQDTFYQLNSDGNGNLGTVSVLACIGSYGCTSGGSPIGQSFPKVTYVASSGAFNVTFAPQTASGNLLPDNQYLYISPDGNFIFGGSPYGWDMFVGVRMGSASSVPNLSGVYYQAGIDETVDYVDATTGAAAGSLDTYYGAATASQGQIWDHQRTSYSTFQLFQPVTVFSLSTLTAANAQFDSTFNDGYSISAGGIYDDPNVAFHYAVSASGAYRIGFDRWPDLGINVAIQAPTFNVPAGPYIYPDGIVNTASGAPFTAPLSRGEEITIYGGNLASSSVGEPDRTPHPTTLNGVQVKINGVPAPIHDVNPGQISVEVPWEIQTSLAQIQVINSAGTSNTVTLFMGTTTPGVYTVPSSGIGYAAAQHTSDYSLITPSNPAQVAEPVVIYVDGLGDVNPPIADGAVGPVSTLSLTVNQFAVSVGGVQVPTLDYVGLVPESAGLYQINFTIPAGVTTGDNIINISGPDSVTSEALISISPVLASASATSPSAIKKMTGHGRPLPHVSGTAASSRRSILP